MKDVKGQAGIDIISMKDATNVTMPTLQKGPSAFEHDETQRKIGHHCWQNAHLRDEMGDRALKTVACMRPFIIVKHIVCHPFFKKRQRHS